MPAACGLPAWSMSNLPTAWNSPNAPAPVTSPASSASSFIGFASATSRKPNASARSALSRSLIFIDRVASYTQPDGLIRTLFHEEFPKAFKDHYGEDATPGRVEEVQSYYFAKSDSGEFTDNENSMAKQKEIYDEILRDKEALLSFGNPRQFIFSHFALGVGWDNPNVFNIATLNQTFSDIKKRQEIGRGLRICRNQEGKRVYDPEGVAEGVEINQLTVIPNETYETFVAQHQSEIGAAIKPRHTHKGNPKNEKIVRVCKEQFDSDRFKKYWKRLGQRTDYTVLFDEEALVTACVAALNKIDEMVRTIDYRPTGEEFGIDLVRDVIPTYREVVPTPHHGIYDHAIIDSGSSYESNLAKQADTDPRVLCVLKLPDRYKIPTPSGNYTPDFGLVVRQVGLRGGAEVIIHLVVETKSTSVLADLDPDQQIKIKCAIRHFHALGIGINEALLFQAPVDRLSSVVQENPPT